MNPFWRDLANLKSLVGDMQLNLAVWNKSNSRKTNMKNGALTFIESSRVILRFCRGFLLNSVRAKAPMFAGHKLTYNCNLKCKMCPFWRRSSENLSIQQEKKILRQIFDSGACAIGFEGGEPLLRKDLTEILAYSRSLPLNTSLITNGTLLKSRIDEIAQYMNGIVFVSLDGLEKTHDRIRGVNGCFKEAVQGIDAAKNKVSLAINTTIMADNIQDVVDTVHLAKDLGVKIVLSKAHDYCGTDEPSVNDEEIKKIAKELIELRKKGYPIMNSVNYFKIIAKERTWKCKPWSTINIGTNGGLVLPCYVYNQYQANSSCFDNGIKKAISGFDWRKTRDCTRCNLHCYVEPSLILSWDLSCWKDWAFPVKR
jgi:radical SAM family uncharacterized protein